MGSLAAGGAATLGTGAFQVTGTRVQRDLSAQISGSASANIGIDPNTGNDFVNSPADKASTFGIDFTADNGADGLNLDGVTEIRPAFTLTNNFSQPVFTEIVNPLRNNNIKNASQNKAGDNVSDDAPAGLDVQFFAATDGVFSAGSAGSKNQGDVALIDRAVAPAATDFQDPKDPSTIQLNLQEDTPNGGDIDYLRVSDGDTGYARLTPGESIDVLVRAIVVDKYLSTNDVGTQLNGEFTIRAMNNEVGMIRTDEVALDTKPISEP